MKETIHFFGYAKVPQDPDNITDFFEYDGSDEEMNRQYRGWRAQNEDMINWVGLMNDQELEGFQYRLSDPAKEVPLGNFQTGAKATTAIFNYYEKKFYNKSSV